MVPGSQPKLTPVQIAKRYGVSADKVRGWIYSGELRAINVATRPGGRPRYAIDEADLLEFESRRQVQPQENPPRSRRTKAPGNVIEFF